MKTIRAYNGTEFVNDREWSSDKKSFFEEAAELKEYIIKRIKHYSLWQNGKPERRHREDEKIVCYNNVFDSYYRK